MVSPKSFLGLALLVAMTTVCAGKELNLVNTITRQRFWPSMASDCKFIRIPPEMCPSCRMRKFDKNGNFPNNRDMFDIDDPACRAGLRRYAELNQCDKPRVRQIASFDAPDSKWRIATFMYNICETCCDCIPFGSKAEDYDKRKKDGKLIFARRGNCPVHVWYDTCRMWPNVTWIGGPTTSFKGVKRSPVCEAIRPWFFDSGFAKGWLKNPGAAIPGPVIKDFLWRFVRVLNCRERTLWEECANLENAQGRLGNDEL